jgi:proline iminopeptidase
MSWRRVKRVSRLSLAFSAALALCSFAVAFGDTRKQVEHTEYVEADGAKLYLMTRGARLGAPLLLWLHGGPGGAERPLFRYFNSALEDRFVIAYWDQRGAARSFDPEADAHELTVTRHLADLDIVIDHLLRTLGKDKVVLIGHSWGAALALLYAHAHPQKLAAVIAVAPVVSTRKQERAQYDFVSREAAQRRDGDALAQLRELGPPPNGSAPKTLAMEKLAARYGGVFHQEPNRSWVMVSGVLRGLATPWEIPSFIRANEASLEAMNRELQVLDLTQSVPRLETPVFFFLGRYDRHIEASVAAAYFEKLQAPVKRLVWFENSAHNPPFEEPDLFNARVSECLQSIGADPIGR